MEEKEFFEKYINRIYCGKSPDELQNFPANTISLTITSPVFYDEKLHKLKNGSNEFGWETYNEYLEHLTDVIAEIYRITMPGGRLVLVLSNSPRTDEEDRIIDYWPIIHDVVGISLKNKWVLQDEAVWITNRPLYDNIKPSNIPETQLIPHHDWITIFRKPGNLRNNMTSMTVKSVWELPNEGDQSKYNQSYGSFPDEFIESCINIWSLENEVVLDPYAGSGQTVRVAIRMNRKGIGIESDPKWRDIWSDINQSTTMP